MSHSDETLSFSSKEKDKITFGKKQSFFPNETINKLTDSYLLDEYKKCKSVQNKIKKFELLLDENNINSTSKKIFMCITKIFIKVKR